MRREVVYQVALVAIVLLVAWLIVSATQANLARLGVDSSVDFLWKRAGFEIGQNLIPYDANSTIARAFLVALLNTLVLALVAIVCASVMGAVIGFARLSKNWLASRLAAAYVETFRNIPSLLQIFFWYFVVLRSLPRPQQSLAFADLVYLNNHGLFLPAPAPGFAFPVVIGSTLLAVFAAVLLYRWAERRRFETGQRVPALTAGIGIVAGAAALAMLASGVTWEVPSPSRFSFEGGLVLMPEFIALVMGLSIYNATYIAEIVRSSFKAVPAGQTEAAEALGLPRLLNLRLILFPQALRIMIPPLTTQYLNMLKGTSLAAAIAYPEIVSVFVGTVNNLVGQPVVIMLITLFTYSAISLAVSLLLHLYDRRVMRASG